MGNRVKVLGSAGGGPRARPALGARAISGREGPGRGAPGVLLDRVSERIVSCGNRQGLRALHQGEGCPSPPSSLRDMGDYLQRHALPGLRTGPRTGVEPVPGPGWPCLSHHRRDCERGEPGSASRSGSGQPDALPPLPRCRGPVHPLLSLKDLTTAAIGGGGSCSITGERGPGTSTAPTGPGPGPGPVSPGGWGFVAPASVDSGSSGFRVGSLLT